MTVTPSERPALVGFGDMPLDLGFGHARIMLKGQRRDRLAGFVAAADAGESDHRANVGSPARQRSRFRGGVERLALQANSRFRAHVANVARSRAGRYPPVIGGKKAISAADPIGVCALT